MTTRRLLESEVPVAEAVVRVLEEVGIELVFAVPGGQTAPLFGALYDHRETIRTLGVREESLAGVMAEVYGRLTGRPGVVIGQGCFLLANALLGTLEAHLGSSPMLLLGDFSDQAPYSHHAPYQIGTGEYGGLDSKKSFEGMTKATMVAYDPSQAVQNTQLAVKHALSGERGPVALLFHSSSLRGEVGPDTRPRIYPTSRYLPGPPAAPDPGQVRAAVRALLRAERPLIVAGNGVRISRAYEQLRDIAELLGAGVTTTASGKGVFRETHEQALGVFGTFGLPLANAVAAEADVVLVVGSKLNPTDTAMENPRLLDPERQTFVQIDIEPRNAGWTFPVDHVLVGDAAIVLAELAREIREVGEPGSPVVVRRRELLEEMRRAHGWFEVAESASEAVPMLPQRVIRELGEATPDDALVVCDAGENRLFMMHHFQTKQAGTYLQPAAIGGMGYAIPAALAAKLVYPDRQAIAVCGDGGFGMALNGLMTAREHGIPIVVVVLNNRALGWVLHGQGDRPIACEFADFDHGAIARAMGCEGIRVEEPGELQGALSAAFASNRPTVIDVVVSREESFRKVTSPLAVEMASH